MTSTALVRQPTEDWKIAVHVALILVVVEGAIRKWLFPGLSDLIYFGKDFALLYAYVSFGLAGKPRIGVARFPELMPLLGLVAAVMTAQALNPTLDSALVGAFGARAYLIYAPLMFLVPHLFDTQRQFERRLQFYLLLLVPVGILGIVQFWSPVNHSINSYVGGSRVAGFGQVEVRARITGTFSYISGYTVYLQVMTALLLPLFAGRKSMFSFITYVALFALIVGNCAMTGSRGAIVWVGATVALFGFSTVGNSRVKFGRYQFALCLAALAGTVGIGLVFDDAWAAIMDRFEHKGDTLGRIQDVLPSARSMSSIGEAFDAAGVLGYGAGATHPGGAAIRRGLGIGPATENPPPAELEYVRVMLELGSVGFLFWYALRIYLIVCVYRVWSGLRDPFLKQICFGAFVIHLLNLPLPLVFNHTMGVYYWLTAGFIFLLPRLETDAPPCVKGRHLNRNHWIGATAPHGLVEGHT